MHLCILMMTIWLQSSISEKYHSMHLHVASPVTTDCINTIHTLANCYWVATSTTHPYKHSRKWFWPQCALLSNGQCMWLGATTPAATACTEDGHTLPSCPWHSTRCNIAVSMISTWCCYNPHILSLHHKLQQHYHQVPLPPLSPQNTSMNYSTHLAVFSDTIEWMQWPTPAEKMRTTMPSTQLNNSPESLPFVCINYNVATASLTSFALELPPQLLTPLQMTLALTLITASLPCTIKCNDTATSTLPPTTVSPHHIHKLQCTKCSLTQQMDEERLAS